MTIGSWTGTGYISLDKATGAGAYMISGSLNGGAKPVIATGMAIYALFMELGSAYFLINALSLVLVPGIIKLAGVALIMQGIYVINMMLIAYVDYMATHDEAYFDQFVNWFLKSGLISSIQLECAYLLLSLFWVAEAWDDEKEDNNAEAETTPETNPETTPETNPHKAPTRSDKLIFGSNTKSVQKLMNQINKRGWTEGLIKDTVDNPFTIRQSINKATGNTASVFYTERGAYVIVDDITNEIVQISDNIDQTTWIPDTSIINPYIPEK